MTAPADERQGTVWFPVPAAGESDSREETGRPGRRALKNTETVPVLVMDMTGGDLFIRGDGTVCLYLTRKCRKSAAGL